MNEQWFGRLRLLCVSLTLVGCGGQLGGTGTQTPPAIPSISASIEPFAPGSDFKLLHISGGAFQANEQVSLTIVVMPDNAPARTLTEVASANGAGHVDHKFSGSGGGVCNPPSSTVHVRYSVKATGGASHKESNTAVAGC